MHRWQLHTLCLRLPQGNCLLIKNNYRTKRDRFGAFRASFSLRYTRGLLYSDVNTWTGLETPLRTEEMAPPLK